jgi:hypothetical protein
MLALPGLVLGTPADAGLIRVPHDLPTIQAGIDAAAVGDTVLVSPGTYAENINFRGKDIVVASHYITDAEYSHVRRTIIDGSHPADPDTASCAVFCSGESAAAILEGFTLTGGGGTEWVDPQYPSYTWRGGGGVFAFQASPTIAHNLVTGNAVINGGTVDGAQGGGITCYGGDPLICSNTVRANEADYGAGIVVDYAGARIRNNLICHNTGGVVYGGGGVWTIGTGPAPILIENNTIVDNHSHTQGGAIYIWSSIVTLRGNILWGNSQGTGGPIATRSGGIAEVTYSDVEGGYTGTGNIDQDPDFGDALNYILGDLSPCIDAGDPDPAFNDPEDPGIPGQARWPSQGGLRNDMGTYGGPGSALFEPGAATAGEPVSGFQDRGGLQQPYPNPLSGPAYFGFELPARGIVDLRIYDVTGALVRRLSSGMRNAGAQHLRWDGCDQMGRPVAGGRYLYRLTGGGLAGSGPLTVVH